MAIFILAFINKQLNNSNPRDLLDDNDEFVVNNLLYIITNQTQHEVGILGCSGECPASITIPSQISHQVQIYKVTSIRNNSFIDGTFTNFTFALPSNLKVIYDGAFNDCIFSKNWFILPETLEILMPHPFLACTFSKIQFSKIIEADTNLFFHCTFTEIAIPARVTKIGLSVFYGSSFQEVVFPETLTEFGEKPFNLCSFSKVKLSSIFEKVDHIIFHSCTFDKVVSYPSLGDNIFYKCVFYDSNMTFSPDQIFGNNTFNMCTFSRVTLPKYLVQLNMSFPFCSFTEFIFPPVLKNITYKACYGITVNIIDLPMSLTTIGNCAFLDSNIHEIHFPPSLTRIGVSACELSTVSIVFFDQVYESKLEAIPSYCFSNCDSLKSIDLPQNLRSIGTCAFYRCSSLKMYTNAYQLQSIGDSAFAYCSQLEMDIIGDMTEIKFGAYSFSFTGIKSVLIMGTIEEGAFYYCTSLTKVLLSSISEVADRAFEGCQAIQNDVEFPNGIERIGKYAFSGCLNMIGSLKMPYTLIEIGEGAFNLCYSLSGLLDIGKTQITEIKKYTFFKCLNMIGYLPFPPTVTKIGECAFSGCHFTGSLVLPDTLTLISDYAFYDNQFFTGNMNIGPQVTEIGKHAFAGCTGFNGQLIFNGGSLTKIGHSAFFGCSNLSGILELPPSLETIGDYAFFGCKGFQEKLKFPRSLKTIGNGAFAECSGFSGQLVIVNSITHIGKNAFFRCSGLTKIKFEEENINVEDNAFGSLHIKCFRNIPKNCTNSKVEDRCYNPDNFDDGIFILNWTFLRESCSLYYAVNIILYIIIGGVVIKYAGKVVKLIIILYNSINERKRRLNAILREIIKREVEILEKNPDQELQNKTNILEKYKIVANRIKDNIVTRLKKEQEGNILRYSEKTIKSMIKKALNDKWFTAPLDNHEYIIQESVKKLNFVHGNRCCNKCLCYCPCKCIKTETTNKCCKKKCKKHARECKCICINCTCCSKEDEKLDELHEIKDEASKMIRASSSPN